MENIEKMLKFEKKSTKKTRIEALCWIILCLGILNLTLISCVKPISAYSSYGSDMWTQDLDDGLIAYWNLSSTLEQIHGDSNFNLNQASTPGTYQIPDLNVSHYIGTSGGSYSFNSDDNTRWVIADFNNLTQLNHTGQNLTIALWIQFSSITNAQSILSSSDGSTKGWEFYKGAGSAPMQPLNFHTGGLISTTSFKVNEWNLITVTKNSSAACIWINGTLDMCKTNRTLLESPKNLTFGGRPDQTGSDYWGLLDEIAMWNLTLNSSQILHLYNEGKGLSRGNLEEESQSFNSTSYEGSTESFVLNLTYDSGNFTNIQGILHYNNTAYTGTKSGTGNNIIYKRTIVTPYVSATTNISFYWTIGLYNTTDWNYYNATIYNQTIKELAIDDCSTYNYLILNFSLKDEETQDILNVGASTYNSSVKVHVDIFPEGSTTSIINYSQNFSNNNNPQICLKELNKTYRMDVEIYYDVQGYAEELYYIQKMNLSNKTAPENIDLFDLDDDDAQQFLITYKDSNFLPGPNVLIEIQRRYVEDGVFKAVEIPKTDEQGQATASFDLTGVRYTILITKNGVVQATFSDVSIYCDDQVIGDCRLNLNALASAVEPYDWSKSGDIIYTYSFNKLTRTITVVFTSTDGSSKTVLLNTTKYDRFGNETVCFHSLTTASGTLTCVIPASYGNTTVISKLYSDGELIGTKINSILPDISDAYGNMGGVLLLLMMLTLPLMMITSTIGVVVGVILGFIFGSILMFYSNSFAFGAGSLIIYLIIAGGIIIWKIAKRT